MLCDGLREAAPTLYGLCVAYHESESSDGRLLAAYDELRKPGDPPMPGVPRSGCPCFNQADLNGIPQPYDQCIVHLRHLQNPSAFWSNILHQYEEGPGGAQSVIDERAAFGGSCALVAFVDGVPVINSVTNLSGEVAESCEDLIRGTVERNVDECLVLVTGDDE
jgi:hypothetical protein